MSYTLWPHFVYLSIFMLFITKLSLNQIRNYASLLSAKKRKSLKIFVIHVTTENLKY